MRIAVSLTAEFEDTGVQFFEPCGKKHSFNPEQSFSSYDQMKYAALMGHVLTRRKRRQRDRVLAIGKYMPNWKAPPAGRPEAPRRLCGNSVSICGGLCSLVSPTGCGVGRRFNFASGGFGACPRHVVPVPLCDMVGMAVGQRAGFPGGNNRLRFPYAN